MNVTIISTNHSELGKCNSDELYKIIATIGPDVIFEELSESTFDKYYKQNQLNTSPEVTTIQKYLLEHNIIQVPVDIEPDQRFSSFEINKMFKLFDNNPFYKQIHETQRNMIASDGYAFLNSRECEKIEHKMKVEEETLIESMPNKNEILEIWTSFYKEQDTREHEIIKNIYKYSSANKNNQGLLLLGCAHRKTIATKIEKYVVQEKTRLNWFFYGD